MYETESNIAVESAAQIAADVLAAFAELQGKVRSRTVLPWSEHCTECVWPTCYSTCDLYSPREDGNCRRFVDGMIRIDCPQSLNGYLLKIRFKRWGKLWTPANVKMRPLELAQELEERDRRIGEILYSLPAPSRIRNFARGKRYSFKKRIAQRPQIAGELPTSFLMECYNPQATEIGLSLTMRSSRAGRKIPYQKLILLAPGMNRLRIPVEEISRVLDLRAPFSIDLTPNEISDGTTLFFGILDFVVEDRQPVAIQDDKKKIKCVVWDLDETLWDGILLEDGLEKLRLKPGVVDVIRELDQRGILHSVASKNDHAEGMKVLEQFGVSEYFLCPQISWRPKSEAIREIARQLNLGMDSFLFIDDSTFEREQAGQSCKGLQTLPAGEYLRIPAMEECRVTVTEESRHRRALYQVETVRKAASENFGEDYLGFLRNCNIELNVHSLTEENLQRVHELTQRTNQMNFSGNRYDREALRKILDDGNLDTYVLDCRDRFGAYGIIGFSVVDRREPRMIDLMFSCRIQSKRIEHAFLSFLIEKHIATSGRDFFANFRRTPRNEQAGQVFEDLGFEEIRISDGISDFRYLATKDLNDDRIVSIHVQSEEVCVR